MLVLSCVNSEGVGNLLDCPSLCCNVKVFSLTSTMARGSPRSRLVTSCGCLDQVLGRWRGRVMKFPAYNDMVHKQL